ncbi:metallophosphoesterase [Imperialibacter roseus]|uniref:Metallophosphoesterase n=1 Tax=Imperialibacter roseus TaxID=1324217 RepID=A0ABZ0IGR5_9BACT|nr:metallophosphoesterase [Imperialibacter roseus]WOK04218.1 metallophosphoesterase [Imperialibacter roseus]
MNYLSAVAIGLLVLGAACTAPVEKASIRIEPIEGPTPYTSLDLNNDPSSFQFAIVTDRTGGHRGNVFEVGLSKLNLLQPEFVMSVGDFIEGYTEDEARLDAEWTEFNGFIDSLTMPFFYVPGNHDITNKVMYDKYKSIFGKDYYHFVYKDVLFLCLNSEDNYRGSGKGTIGDEQYEWIEKTLAANADVKWTLVFMHQPLWNQQAETLRWPDVEKLLEPRKHTVYVGHHHSYVKYERNNGKYFILATTGGGSRLRGPRFGEFDHVVWITMTDNGPIMANLELSGVWDENVVTEQSSNYFRPLFNGQPVRVSPMFTDGSTFSNGATEIRLTNDSDAPMDVSFELAANKYLTSSIIRQSLTIAPNSVEILPLKLSGKAASVAALEPVALRGTVTFHGEGMADITMDVTQNARPAKKEYLAKSATKTVDGNLDDWASLPFSETEMYTEANPFSHKGGKADGSVRFGISCDDEFLYIGADITDDELLAVASSRPYNQDAFQVIVDGRSENISSFGTSLSGVLYIGMSPYVDGTNNTTPFTSGNKPEGLKGITVKTDKGYATELAIPLSYLSEQQGGDWKTARINVGVNDFDNDYSHRTNLWWQPDWRGAGSYPGSGTFFRK